jgi:hypothetical protein
MMDNEQVAMMSINKSTEINSFSILIYGYRMGCKALHVPLADALISHIAPISHITELTCASAGDCTVMLARTEHHIRTRTRAYALARKGNGILESSNVKMISSS